MRSHTPPLQTALFILVLYVKSLQAEGDNSVAYKFHYYQEDDDRISVLSHYVYAATHPTLSTDVNVMALVDSISGASPIGTPAPDGSDQVPLSELEDTRYAGSVDVVHRFDRYSLAGKIYMSKEDDYRSTGYALNGTVDFDERNTTLALGFAYDDDSVEPAFFEKARPKLSNNYFIGITQLINPDTYVGINYTYINRRGYQSDPYKLVLKTLELLPGLYVPQTFAENRPSKREIHILQVNGMHYIQSVDASIQLTYRFFTDDWNIDGHTFEVTWNQKLGAQWIVSPVLRYYTQSRAGFYHPTLDGTDIEPLSDYTGTGPYYSADHRLAQLDTVTYGVQVSWQALDWLSFDAAVERYAMQNQDDLAPDSAFPGATIINVGAKIWF